MELNISDNSIGDAGMVFLEKMMMGKYTYGCQIEKFDISKNGITPGGTMHMYKGMA
jgi:hypothetical protein